MGAWIEILRKAMERKTDQVAPHVGAWIEICKAFDTIADNAGRTPRGCVD